MGRRSAGSALPGISALVFCFGLQALATDPPPKYRVCKNNLRAKFWAQLTVDSDLMQDELKRFALAPEHTHVAVIDSGFDRGNRPRMAVPKLEVLRSNADAGPADVDKDGHGTMVAGLIGGADGVGIAPDVHLTVYRVTRNYGSGISSDVLNKAIVKACEDGNEIINVSWGSVSDEAGFERDEVSEKETFEKLRAKGCLVIKSAGNSSYRSAHQTDELADGYLRVAALNTSSTLSAFSSRGEVGAPGSFVYTLESQSRGYSHEKSPDRRCDTDLGIFTNGTSFSSPITAAVAAEVLGVLKQDPNSPYAKLSVAEKTRLLPYILQASEVQGTISGLRAILIAERWLRSPVAPEKTSPEKLSELLEQDPPNFCQPDLAEVDSYQRLDRLRRELSVCKHSDETRTRKLSEIIRYLVAIGNAELAIRWVAIAGSEGRIGPDLAQQIDWLWRTYQIRWMRRGSEASRISDAKFILRYGLDFDEAIALAIPYVSMRKKDTTGRKQVDDALSMILESYAMETRLSRRDGRGSEEDIVKVTELFKQAGEILDRPRLAAIVKQWTDRITAYQNQWERQTGRQLLTAFRIIDSLQGADLDLPKLPEAELEIFRKSNATNKITLERVAKEKPSQIELSFFGDLNNFHVGYLDPFFERHHDAIFREVGLDQGQFHPEKLNPFFLIYFLKSEKLTLTPTQREQMLLSTLRAVADHRGWDQIHGEAWYETFDEDDKITETARDGLQTLVAKATAPEAERIRGRYRALFRQAGNLSFYRAELPRITSTYLPPDKMWEYSLARNPLLDRASVETVALRLIQGIPVQSSEFKIRNSSTLGELIGRVLPIVPTIDLSKVAKPLVFPYFSDLGVNRLEPGIFPWVNLGEPLPPKEAVLKLAQNWIEFMDGLTAKDWKRSYGIGKILQSLRNEDWSCTLVGNDPISRAGLEKLATRLKSASAHDEFGTDTFDTKWSVERLLQNCKRL